MTITMYRVVLLAILLGQVCSVYGAGASEPCSKTADCESDKGLICLFAFSTCSKGYCFCPTGQTYSTTCRTDLKELFVGDVCTGSDDFISVPHATCIGTTVTCPDGYDKVSSSFCKAPGEAALGEDCSGGETCITYGDKIAASSVYTLCQNGVCVCNRGYVVEKATLCRPKTVGDPCTDNVDCLKINQECSTGSNAKCQCKADTQLVDGECLVQGTVAERGVCESSPYGALLRKETTCSIGLMCAICPETTDYVSKCLMPAGPDENSPDTVQGGAVKYGQACSVTSECESGKGLECVFPYSTCTKGRCVCPDGQTYTTAGTCNIAATDTTPSDSSVSSCEDPTGGKPCVCSEGYIVDLTTSTLCRQKTVGDTCAGDTHCKKKNQECSRGNDTKCQCVDNTDFVDGECQVQGSVAEGKPCDNDPSADYVDQANTCSIGLTCGLCPEDTGDKKKCLKVTVPTTESPTTTTENAGTAVGPVVLTFLTAFFLGFLGTGMI